MTRYWRRLRRAYYGWWMLAGSVMAVALAAGISFWSFGLYIEPLEREFGWSRAEISGGFSVGFFASALAAPLYATPLVAVRPARPLGAPRRHRVGRAHAAPGRDSPDPA